MKIDYTYIINLNTEVEEIRKKINQIDWPYDVGYYVLPATNGWEAVKDSSKSRFHFKIADWWKIDNGKDFYTREVTPGEAGCMLSHYECIVNGYNDGYENILIFEEDFYTLGKFPTQTELNAIPSDASLVYLDRHQNCPDWDEERVNDHVTKVGYSYNNHAYIMTRSI